MVSSLLHSLSRLIRLIDPVVHLGSVLPGPAFLDDFLHHAFECADAVPTLSVSGQRVMAGKRVPTEARVGFGAGMDLGVPF